MIRYNDIASSFYKTSHSDDNHGNIAAPPPSNVTPAQPATSALKHSPSLYARQPAREATRGKSRTNEIQALKIIKCDIQYICEDNNLLCEKAAKALIVLSYLTKLSAVSCKIRNKEACILAKSPLLTTLHLSHNNIGSKGYIALFKNSTLTFLDISHNLPLEEKSAIDALLKNTQLCKIGLRSLAADDKVAMAVAKIKSLLEIDLSRNNITDDGLASLTAKPNLEKLWLRGNNISAKNLLCNRTLTLLDLSENSLTGFPDRWKKEPQLVELHLDKTELSDEKIANLQHCSKLEILSLSSNNLKISALDPLTHLPKLKMLCISNNNITEECKLADMLDRYHALLELDLSDNPGIGDATAARLATHLSLKNVDLRGTFVGQLGAKLLARNEQIFYKHSATGPDHPRYPLVESFRSSPEFLI